ncbi:hypothetical protein LQF67_01595 [Tetragenococcus halophilus]|uniref:hypothetical protein n=1 Tax=Tetragenococcus halophilus TaxID=51669 RepID=UPI001F1EDD08|nr:hypothetical protein [Tetragenococcus halophilus]MCF1684272.1 hypothetical protein [Tetragenococcus halophilus]
MSIKSKAEKYLAKRNLSGPDTDAQDQVFNISTDLAGSGLMKFGIGLSGKAEDKAKIGYLSALVEQNWIIIKQQDENLKEIREQK